jgi:phosphohistidine phosphatase
MRLWIVRHGKAEQSSPTGRDEDRPLMTRGRRQAEWLGETIAGKKRRPELILSSGLARAIATAELIQQRLGCDLEVLKALETGHTASEVVDLLQQRFYTNGLMIVGHNPTFGELVWILERGLPVQEAAMRTGEAVVFEFEEAFGIGRGKLHKRLRMDDGE